MGFIYDNPELEYEAIKNSVLSFYSPSSDIWQRVNAGSATSGEVLRAFSNIPNMQVVRSADGTRTLGYDYFTSPKPVVYADDYDDIAGAFNSNNLGGGFSNANSYNFPGYAQYNGGGPNDGYNFLGGAKDGIGNTVSVIADKVSLAVAGVNIGAKLGMAIDGALYNLNPRWWNEHYPTINPQTWDSICTTDGGKTLFRTLFGIPSNANPTAYISVDALAYTYQLMRDSGFWGDGSEHVVPPTQTEGKLYYPDSYGNPIYISTSGITFERGSQTEVDKLEVSPNSGASMHFYTYKRLTSTSESIFCIVSSATSGSVHVKNTKYNPSTGHIIREREYDTTLVQKPFKDYATDGYCYVENLINIAFQYFIDASVPYIEITGSANNGSWDRIAADIEYLTQHGTIEQSGAPEGVSAMPDSTQYPPTRITGTTTADVLQQLRQEYPDLFTDSIHTSTLQDDGTIEDDEYIPIPWVDIDSTLDDQVITGDTQQTDTEIQPEDFIKLPNETTNPPDTGGGNGPSPAVPVGNASSLWAVYNPSQSILNSFGSWLWSSDLVDQIKRLFFDPMQGVIGVHKVFAPVPTGGSQNIKVGYIDSGISCPTVSNQYTEIDCGTVRVDEFFGNVLDYEPFTQISAYLPFIGVVRLSTSDVMRGKVNITYGVDVITGACLAKIKITRDGNGGILYSFGGSCAVHYPLSSGSYSGIISGIVSAAVGVGTSIATGNPLAAVGGAVSGIHQARLDVSKSGGFTGASGATGPKTPYLIISRPQSAMARNFDLMTGYPANNTVQVDDCDGFIKCREVHIESATATKDEKTMIEDLLKSGILI